VHTDSESWREDEEATGLSHTISFCPETKIHFSSDYSFSPDSPTPVCNLQTFFTLPGLA